MNAFREALADKYHQYRLQSLEEVLDRIKAYKREFPKVEDRFYAAIEKDMTRIYTRLRRALVGYGVYQGLTVLGTTVIPDAINDIKKELDKEFTLIRKTLEETNKVPVQEQYLVFNREWANDYGTENKHHTKFKREEEVEVPLVTPIPKEMGTTNPLVRPDATETINPLARK